jgi:hypothetical protein
MGDSLQKLSDIHTAFLKYPLENFSLFNRMRPPTLDEIAEDINRGLGGDCNSLSAFIYACLRRENFDCRIVHLDNNLPELDWPIKIERPIEFRKQQEIKK